MWLLCKFKKSRAGAAMIEFALVLPVLVLLFLGMVETAHFLLFREKMESAASQLLDIMNQNQNLDVNSLNNLYAVVPEMMKPYPADQARTVVTQIVRPISPVPNRECSPTALWQYPQGGSKIAPNVGGGVVLGEINMAAGDNVSTIEITMNYKPYIDNKFTRTFLGGAQNMYTATYAHARYGSFNLDPVTRAFLTAPCN
jgi:hypothetical protein